MVVVVDELVVEVELVLDVTVELGAKEVVSSGMDDSWVSELLPQLALRAAISETTTITRAIVFMKVIVAQAIGGGGYARKLRTAT